MHLYRRVWSAGGVRRLLLANLLSASGIGAMPVAVLLALQARFGSLGTAGVSAGLFGVGNAIGLIIQGRLLDRRRQRMTVVIAGAACVSTLIGLLCMINSHVRPSPWVMSAGFLCAGIFLPGITAAVRSRLAVHPDLDGGRLAAYSVLSVTFQAGVAIGPLLVSAVLLAVGPTAGLLVPIAALAAAVGCFSTARRAPGPAMINEPAPQDRGHGVPSGVVALVAAAVATGAASGMTAVGIPGVAAAGGHATFSGVQFAAIAVGDLAGGLVYGARTARMSVVRHLMLGQSAALVCSMIVVAVTGSAPLLTIALMLGAAVASPTGIAVSALLDSLARPSGIAAGYTMIVSGGLIGSAIASSVAGRLADALAPRVPFFLAPACLAGALLIYLIWVRPLSVRIRRPGS